MERMVAVYRVRSDAASIEARAQAIAVEQSVELPLDAIFSEAVLRDIAGEVQAIREIEAGLFEVRIRLAAATAGCDAGQLLNMLFGNTILQEDVTFARCRIPDAMAANFGGPNYGIGGLRKICGAGNRPLTCVGAEAAGLAAGASSPRSPGRLAAGGIDFIKDDHGLADQSYSRFAERVRACAGAAAMPATIRAC